MTTILAHVNAMAPDLLRLDLGVFEHPDYDARTRFGLGAVFTPAQFCVTPAAGQRRQPW